MFKYISSTNLNLAILAQITGLALAVRATPLSLIAGVALFVLGASFTVASWAGFSIEGAASVVTVTPDNSFVFAPVASLAILERLRGRGMARSSAA